jgi:hypothetical protein
VEEVEEEYGLTISSLEYLELEYFEYEFECELEYDVDGEYDDE